MIAPICPQCRGARVDVASAPTDRGVERVEADCSFCEGHGTDVYDCRKPTERALVAKEFVSAWGPHAALVAVGYKLSSRDPQASYEEAAKDLRGLFVEMFGCGGEREVALGLDVVRLDAAFALDVHRAAIAFCAEQLEGDDGSDFDALDAEAVETARGAA